MATMLRVIILSTLVGARSVLRANVRPVPAGLAWTPSLESTVLPLRQTLGTRATPQAGPVPMAIHVGAEAASFARKDTGKMVGPIVRSRGAYLLLVGTSLCASSCGGIADVGARDQSAADSGDTEAPDANQSGSGGGSPSNEPDPKSTSTPEPTQAPLSCALNLSRTECAICVQDSRESECSDEAAALSDCPAVWDCVSAYCSCDEHSTSCDLCSCAPTCVENRTDCAARLFAWLSCSDAVCSSHCD